MRRMSLYMVQREETRNWRWLRRGERDVPDKERTSQSRI